MPDRPQFEFRGFVSGGKLNAITQYFTCCYFPELVARKASIENRVATQDVFSSFFQEELAAQLREFHLKVRDLIQAEHYVIDFLVLRCANQPTFACNLDCMSAAIESW